MALPFGVYAQTTLPTVWNFSTPGISTPPVGWTTGLGTNGNLTYSGAANSVGGDNTSCRFDATGEFLTIWFAEKPGELSYWIKGTGISPNPAFTGTFSVQESVDGSSWSDLRAFTTMTGTMTRFVNTPAPASRYVRFFYTEKLAGSNVALDSVRITAPPAPPAQFVLRQQTATLINGNTFVVGNRPSTLFTMLNTGTSQNVRTDSIILSGTHAADFSIGAFDSITPFGSNDTFSVSLNSASPGSRFATMTIYHSDAERSPFVVNLYGVGGAFATEPTVQVPNLSISNIRPFAFNIGFNRATGAEGYIVLRKQGGALTEVPQDGINYKRGDYIGGAQVAYIGSDTAVFKPNYILANTDYAFAAFAFNGPTGYENYLTTSPANASVTTPGSTPGSYYDGINPNAVSFITDLHQKIRQVDTIFYSNYAPVLVNNYLARDTSAGRKVVTCVYSNEQYVFTDPFTWWTGQGNNPGTLTREHTFAQSWMPTNQGGSWPDVGGREVLEYNDLHNLFPAHQLNANAKRSNNPFGIVVNPTYTAPTGVGKLGTDANGATVYEPKDDQKGDLARALFYMLVRYNTINGVQWRLPASQNINILLQWHLQDPPSSIEIARNEYIATTQKNRNPFIDYPEWVNRIDFSNMTYIVNPTAEIISLTAPNGGENWVAGQQRNITFFTQNVDSVTIAYKTTTTGSYTPIASVASSGTQSYSWTVPAVASNAVKVLVFKKSNSALSDSSNANFTIQTPSLSLVYPDTAAFWYINKQSHSDSILWTSSLVDSISIDLLIQDTLFKRLGNAKASAGKWVFSPDALSLPLTGSAKINIQSLSGFAVSDTSARAFSIMQWVGLKELGTLTSVQLAPNPSSGLFHVLIDQPDPFQMEITIRDITGREVLTQSITSPKTALQLQERGVFFITIRSEKGSYTQKLIVQ